MGIVAVLFVVVGVAALAAVAVGAVAVGYDLETMADALGETTRGEAVASVAALAALFAGPGSVFALAGRVPAVDLPMGVSTVVFGLGAVGVVVGALRVDEYWAAARTPVVDAAAVGEGRVAVSGSVVAEDTVETPFAGVSAVYCDYEVEEYADVGDRHQWLRVDSGERSRPFRVRDRTGEVWVDPAGADVAVGTPERWRVEGDESPPDRVAAHLADADLDPTDDDRRFTETFLAPGDPVYVLGRARVDDRGRLVVDGSGDHLLLRDGDTRGVPADVRLRVLVGGVGGLLAAAVGYLGMLVGAGVVP